MQDSIWLPSTWTTTSTDEKCSYVLGIDFGTSNSVVGIWRSDKGRVKVIKNALGDKSTPSRITFLQDFEHYSIGKLAPNNTSESSTNTRDTSTRTIVGIKNLLGADSSALFADRFSNLLEEIEEEDTLHHVEVKKKVVVICQDEQHRQRTFHPEELVAMVLSELRSNAIKYLQGKPIQPSSSSSSTVLTQPKEDVTAIHRVVIGIPAHFTEQKKDCLRHAANMAGFEEVHFLVESTAAAMAYGLLVAGKKNVLVFDMGGGTLDLTILHIDEGTHQVLYTGGHGQLGGQQFDFVLFKLIQEKLVKVLKKKGVVLPSTVLDALPCRNLLMEESRQCKEQLSSVEEVDIMLDVEHLSAMGVGADVLQQLGWTTPQTSSSSSSSRDAEKSRQSSNNHSIKLHIHRDEFLDISATLFTLIQETTYHVIQQCKQLHGGDDASSFTLDEIILVGGSSRIPQVQHHIRVACGKADITTFNVHSTHEFCTSISPEYAVVEGLAIRGAILRGEDSDSLRHMLMLDCLPTTIGILSHEPTGIGKYFEPILLQGSKLPIEMKKTFYLEKANQSFVSLDIYEEVEEMHWVEAQQRVESKYKYQVLVTVDAPINQPSGYELDDDEDSTNHHTGRQVVREVEVIFKVDAEGQLSYDVQEVLSTQSNTSNNNNPRHSNAVLRAKRASTTSWTSSQQSKMLILYIVLLALVYVSLKYVFPPDVDVQQTSTEEEDTHVQSLPEVVSGVLQQVLDASNNDTSSASSNDSSIGAEL